MENLASTTTVFLSTMSEYFTQLVVFHDKYQIHLFLALLLLGYVISLLKLIQISVQELEGKQYQTLLQKLTDFLAYFCSIRNILLAINILTHYFKPSLFSTDLPKFAISHLLENPYLAYFILSLVLILIEMIIEVYRGNKQASDLPFSLIEYLLILFLTFLRSLAIFYFKAIFSNSILFIIITVCALFYYLSTIIFMTLLTRRRTEK
jgi:hypothetical protein